MEQIIIIITYLPNLRTYYITLPTYLLTYLPFLFLVISNILWGLNFRSLAKCLIHPFIQWFIHLLDGSFVSIIHPFIGWFVPSFLHSFIPSSIHPSIHSFVVVLVVVVVVVVRRSSGEALRSNLCGKFVSSSKIVFLLCIWGISSFSSASKMLRSRI